MNDQDLRGLWAGGTEGTLVAGGCGVEVVGAFGQILLFGLAGFLEEEMAVLESDCDRFFVRERVLGCQAAELGFGEGYGFLLLELGQWRKAVVGRVIFPFEGKVSGAEQGVDEGLEDALAIGAVGEDEDAVAVFAEDEREMAPALVVPFFKEGFAVG